jgi:homocysteine S-methyltransferase
LTNQLPSAGPDIIQAAAYSPSRLAELAADWKAIGAQIIGGCCASGPEHIAAIRRVVSDTDR